jgi:hypothetical protein
MPFRIRFPTGGVYFYCSKQCVGVEKPAAQADAEYIKPEDVPAGQRCHGCGYDLAALAAQGRVE